MAEEAKSWTVNFVNERQDLTPSGQFKDVVEVHYITNSGVRGSVTVPKEEYLAGKTDGYIRPMADMHEQTMTS